MIKVVDLKKFYRMGTVTVRALRGINLTIEDGESLSIMGPSGSGKSTLLNLLGALDKPTSGSVYFDGIDLARVDESVLYQLRRKKVGFVFQSFNLIPTLSALENVLIPLVPTTVSKIEGYKRAKELLVTVGLEKRILHKPSEMSGGEQQRVAVARALINNPKIILADEPTGNVDTKTGKEIINLLGDLNRNMKTTLIVVTHDPEISKSTERIIRLRDGAIVE
ncbi:MAG: ABC transporter ATP-binding protein [Theionarchaea archaeon]|nr:ABC transporter ATP-binding protein [Theionarchaea archaeon]